MAVTAALVKELRELTGAGMLDCKNALTETDGDIKRSIDILREKGLAAAAKKAGRIAADGLVHVMVQGNKGAVVEVNCETDFVAKTDDFKGFVNGVAKQALATGTRDIETFLGEDWLDDPSIKVRDALSGKVAIFGEKIDIRRFDVLEKGQNGCFATYIHGFGKIAVLLELECEKTGALIDEAGKNLSMQIAALFPRYVSRSDMPEDFINSERDIIKALTMNEEAENENKKPQQVLDKMIEGRLTKQLKELCLLDQMYVKQSDITVSQYLENVSKEIGAPVAAKRFICYEKGEGIEKRVDNLGEEVSKMISG